MRDLRKYSKITNIRLFIGAVLLIFIVGDGLIWFIYGEKPAIMGLICLIAGLIPVILIFIVFTVIDRITARENKDD